MKRHRSRSMTLELKPVNIWIPGRYILLINDAQDASVFQVDFTLDEAMNATCGQPKACQRGGVEEVLICCLQDKDDYWERIASRPGMAQFRRKIMETRQLVLYNEFRKENDLDEMIGLENVKQGGDDHGSSGPIVPRAPSHRAPHQQSDDLPLHLYGESWNG